VTNPSACVHFVRVNNYEEEGICFSVPRQERSCLLQRSGQYLLLRERCTTSERRQRGLLFPKKKKTKHNNILHTKLHYKTLKEKYDH